MIACLRGGGGGRGASHQGPRRRQRCGEHAPSARPPPARRRRARAPVDRAAREPRGRLQRRHRLAQVAAGDARQQVEGAGGEGDALLGGDELDAVLWGGGGEVGGGGRGQHGREGDALLRGDELDAVL